MDYRHVFSGILLIAAMLAYFTWRAEMIGMGFLIHGLFVVFSFGVGIIYLWHYWDQEDPVKRKQGWILCGLIISLFIAAFLIRLIFLS